MELKLNDIRALGLAEKYKIGDGGEAASDPFPDVPCALLSADHITKYVLETGMVAPFDGEVYKKCPLKAASYEGKIGNCAYIFEKGISHPKKIFDGADEYLKVPANSIIFVECDKNFRLPSFIAVRFNLQIKHVHRGLLLGTGPLVDPCFWGKLCIPLHNLTNEDYYIPKTEGLIWIEFTKTSSSPTLGRPPSNTNLDDIKKAIEDAARQLRPEFSPIAIRSSIPDMVETANQKASLASTSASNSEAAAKSMRTWSLVGVFAGAISVFALAATVAGLSWTYYLDTKVRMDSLENRIKAIEAPRTGEPTGWWQSQIKSLNRKDPED